jgi:hypothetical protein
MGYTTWFSGQFDFNKPLDDKTYELLVGLSETRRTMKAFKQEQGFGIDGEFYIGYPAAAPGFNSPSGFTVDDNKPPRTQPGLWLSWCPTEDRLHLKWNDSKSILFSVATLLFIRINLLANVVTTLSPLPQARNSIATYSGSSTSRPRS